MSVTYFLAGFSSVFNSCQKRTVNIQTNTAVNIQIEPIVLIFIKGKYGCLDVNA